VSAFALSSDGFTHPTRKFTDSSHGPDKLALTEQRMTKLGGFRAIGALGLVVLAGAAAWWWLRPAEAPRQRPAAGDAAVTVTTAPARRQDFALELAATGAVSSLNRVEIRPQFSAAILQVHIREGQAVRAGQLLFTLDSRAAEVRVLQAQAQLQRDQATLADVERQLARSRDLLRQAFVSQSAVDTLLAQVESQQAVVAADRAAIQAARVDQGYARVTAPNAGRVGAIGVYAGSYVTPAGAALATITQLDPIAVSFPVPQRHIADLLAALRGDGGRVEAVLPDAVEGQRTLEGRLQFVDSAVDAGSGTVQAKAQFANAAQRLWPGAYVDVKVALRTLPGAILIPQAAIIQNAQSRSVYVVGREGKVALKPIELITSAGDQAVVGGLQAGERVVVDGKQNLRPGSTVAEQGAAQVAAAQPAGASRPAP
jgi:membrane fusion protein, multidrug efflux system